MKKRIKELLPVFVALVVVGAYAALLPGGRWQGDDYLGAALVARGDWNIEISGLKWGPRPFSAPLTWLYFAISAALDRPLIVYFLASLWVACVAGVALAGRVAQQRRPGLLALQLLALTLLLSKPGEMFYWPVGASAYLPCWAGLAAATVLHRGAVERFGAALMPSLLVAVFSAEIGAVTLLIHAGLVALVFARDQPWRRLRPLLVPAVGAAGVCLTVLTHRMAPMSEVMTASGATAGHWAASLGAALPDFARQVVSIDGLPAPVGILAKLCVLLGFRADGAPSSARPAVLWGLSLLLGAFASVVLAYHQFGTLCCERHDSLRQGMIVLALASFAGAWRGSLPVSRQAVLGAVLALLLAVRAAPLRADWRALPQVIAARQRTWQTARAPGGAMTLFLAPPGRITNGDELPAGHYRRQSDAFWGTQPWYVWGVMARFDKRALTIEPGEK